MSKKKITELKQFVSDCLEEQNILNKEFTDHNETSFVAFIEPENSDVKIETYILLFEDHLLFVCPYPEEYEYKDLETAINLSIFFNELNEFTDGQFHINPKAKRPCCKLNMFLPEDWQLHKDVSAQLFKRSCTAVANVWYEAAEVLYRMILGEIIPDFQSTLGISIPKETNEAKTQNINIKRYS